MVDRAYARKVSSVTDGATRGELTRESLLRAASERFARDGYQRTSVADISRDAGVGGTTAFVHYPNKEALFFAAVDADLTALFDEFGAALAALGPDEQVSDRILDAVLATVDDHPLARRLLAGLEPTFTERVLQSAAFAELRRVVSELIAGGQAEGIIRPDVTPTDLADGLVSAVVAMSMASVQIGDDLRATFGAGFSSLLRVALSRDPRQYPPANSPRSED